MTLPGEFFTSPRVYEKESQKIFRRSWICVGRTSELPKPGDFIVREIDDESIIIVRDETDTIRSFYNVCRHRGTRLQQESCGQFRATIQCPYHAWSYDLQGGLRSAPNISSVAGFDSDDYGLHRVSCQIWQGFILINRDAASLSLDGSFKPFHSRFDAWNLGDLISAHSITYEIRANWKIVFQNYSECYHCSLVHPQLNPVTSVKTASNDFTEGQLLGGPMLLSDQHATISSDGSLCGELFPELSTEDRQRVYFYTLFPTLFISPHPDYVLIHRVERRAFDSTRVVCEWLFPQHVINQPEFDPSGAVEFWDLTNRQDWSVCEMTQQGVQSEAYQPGPYSSQESMLVAFDRHYLSVMETVAAAT